MHPLRDGLLFGATALAEAVNAIAGGGTLLSFPAALAWGLRAIRALVVAIGLGVSALLGYRAFLITRVG